MSKRISLEAHKKELIPEVFTSISIKISSYQKLAQVGKHFEKTPEQTLEGYIDDMYNYLKEDGEI